MWGKEWKLFYFLRFFLFTSSSPLVPFFFLQNKKWNQIVVFFFWSFDIYPLFTNVFYNEWIRSAHKLWLLLFSFSFFFSVLFCCARPPFSRSRMRALMGRGKGTGFFRFWFTTIISLRSEASRLAMIKKNKKKVESP